MANSFYLCIDLKSFFASVECVERGLDPMTTNLVVADYTRGLGALCLAVTPALKKKNVQNRCRLSDIPKEIDYIIAKPRMKFYIRYSADIYSLYLRYLSADDIHVYSIDECFLDVTHYLSLYKMTAHEMAQKLIDEIYQKTGIRATAGIGTNLFLAKVALDIMAKHNPSNIGFLDQQQFFHYIWHHRPITDIWNIGSGIAKRLAQLGCFDLYDVAHFDEKRLYQEFGVNAEYLIDHSHGIEPCTIKEIHDYKAKSKSLSNGQILFEEYAYEDAFLVMKEMVELLTLELVDKHLVAGSIFLSVGYARKAHKSSKGNMQLESKTASYQKILQAFSALFEKIVNPYYPIKRIYIGFGKVIENTYASFDLLSPEDDMKEQRVQETILEIKKRYGKNAILRGMNLESKATTRKRNKLIGGHNSE